MESERILDDRPPGRISTNSLGVVGAELSRDMLSNAMDIPEESREIGHALVDVSKGSRDMDKAESIRELMSSATA
jgi:hypothetical protein